MESLYLNLSDTIHRILDRAAQNLSIEKLLIYFHVDPNHLTYDTLIQRLVDFAIAHISIPNVCALVGAGLYAATFIMRTMVPLRIFGIISTLFFMAYGILDGIIVTVLLYLVLFSVNSFRLWQILRLVKKAKVAAEGDLSMDWLKPFMHRRNYRKGDVLFRKRQKAKEMFLISTGKFLVTEIGIELLPGKLVGELGFLTHNNQRTQSVECTEDGSVLTISYDRLLEVYFEYPDFGYYFLRLSSERLIQNTARLEGIIEQYRAQLAEAASRSPDVNEAAPAGRGNAF
jgi:Cyclic nucleotide-binding domain